MFAALNLSGFGKSLGASAQAATTVEATLELAPEPTLSCRTTAITPKRRRFLEPAPRQPSAKEHAQALLDWIRANIDPSSGPITHCMILEYYAEMLIERGWRDHKWNPVAHQFRLLTTGNRKTYAWITTTTGAVHRLRVYPIPERAVCATTAPETAATEIGSRGVPKLRRAA